jgi:lipopolysaccharide/colanic/teichoic acid biosynthesis glycosyltransferase
MLMPTEAQARPSPATPKTTTGNGTPTTYDWVATYESWQQNVRSAAQTDCTETSLRDRARRTVNFLLATVALIVTMPLMILIGVLIKLTSPGPIL